MIEKRYSRPNVWIYSILFAGMTIMLSLSACQNDDFSTSSNIVLDFSVDTLRLDTVFTARGSATYILKVFNPSDENVLVQSIKLLDDTNFFRLNVDGINGNEAIDVPIYAKDSIYIFCEVTIDPDQPVSISPFVIHDRIEFITNGNQQTVHLEAWGQNANYFPGPSNKARVSLLTCDNGEVLWDDEKPYVIYGVVFIDSCLLRVMEGTKIYVHGGPVSNELGVYNDGILFTLPNGKMRLDGTLENPIIIQDDRLEPAFEDVPGQWSGLRFGPLSRGNAIRHTIIKNCVVGIQMDSLAEANINNVEIYNTAGSGIVSVYADLDITNSLIHDNGGSCISVIHGGVARLKYCTLSNFGNESAALNLTNFRCYDALCSASDVKTLNAQVFNSIIVGDDRDEISLTDGTTMTEGDFNYLIDHCLYKATKLPEDIPDFISNCVSCVEYDVNGALFVDRRDNDFHLDSLSQVEGLAKSISIARTDKDERVRDLMLPDIGCYEYVNQ